MSTATETLFAPDVSAGIAPPVDPDPGAANETFYTPEDLLTMLTATATSWSMGTSWSAARDHWRDILKAIYFSYLSSGGGGTNRVLPFIRL